MAESYHSGGPGFGRGFSFGRINVRRCGKEDMFDKPNGEHDISFQQGVIAMGVEKNKLIDAEDIWMEKAKFEGIKCSMCGSTISYGDRELYFRENMCGSCHSSMMKE